LGPKIWVGGISALEATRKSKKKKKNGLDVEVKGRGRKRRTTVKDSRENERVKSRTPTPAAGEGKPCQEKGPESLHCELISAMAKNGGNSAAELAQQENGRKGAAIGRDRKAAANQRELRKRKARFGGTEP